MTDRPDPQVTQLLERARQGDAEAMDAALEHLYDEIKAIATHRMRGLSPAPTLQPTALVNEGRWCMNPQMTDLPQHSRLQAPIAADSGLPSSVIRFRTSHAMRASTLRPASLRARKRSPTIVL